MRNLRITLALAASLTVLLVAACRTTESPERQANDMAITAQVKSKLASDVQLSTIANIDVNTTNGVVTLSGQVSSDDVKRRAEEVARNTPKVIKVNNNLQVGS